MAASWWAPRLVPAVQAASAVGVPLAVFAAAGNVQAGAAATHGALAALYAHGLPPARRAERVAIVGLGLVLAAGAGTLAVGSTGRTVAAIALVAGLGTAWTRRRSVSPPGPLMPVLVCALLSQVPLSTLSVAARLTLVALGALIAWLIVMAGAPWGRRLGELEPPQESAPPSWDHVLRAVFRVALGTGGAALVALSFGLPRPDWAAVACMAVLVRDATRDTVRRALHRALGTAAGIGVTGLILAASPGSAGLVVLIVGLQFVVELLVVENYALAVVFITPLALVLGIITAGPIEAGYAGILGTRLLETVVGCAIAVAAQALLPPPGERAGKGSPAE